MCGDIMNNKFVIDNMIFLTEEQYNKYILKDKGEIISSELLHDLLDNDYFYGYTLDLFNEKIKDLSIVYVDMNGINKINKYYKMDILKAFSKAILNDKLILKGKNIERFKEVTKYVSYEAFKEKYIDEDYTCVIDSNKVVIPVSLIITFLECSNEEYDKFFNLEKSDKIIGIKKEYFIYAIIKFFRINNILNTYYIPENLVKRYKELLDSRKIDLQALNKINETHNVNKEKIKLDEEFQNYILNSIPPNLNSIEKAIYIYLKLCDTLTYDEEFYALNGKEELHKKHENIKRLESINLKNNNVICYEFNAIYSKFLDIININYETNASFENVFGGGHEDLIFKCYKYLVKADSTITTLIYSDIVNVKIGKKLNGLICQNINEKTRKEFNKILTKTYNNYLKEKEIKFDELIIILKNMKENLNLEDRFMHLLKMMDENKLNGLDAMSYIHQVIKLLFNTEEIKKYIKFIILRINYLEIKLCSIIEFKNNYYLYIPNKMLAKIEKETLKNLLEKGMLEYIDLDHTLDLKNQKIKKITKQKSL